jgi:rRNA maturation protein Nop10
MDIDHGGSIMARITAEELKKRREEFQEEAGAAFDRMLGSDGQNGLVTFAEREERACELGDGLTRRLLEEHLSADEAAEAGMEVACPICGGAVVCEAPEEVELENRQVRTRRGTVEYERAARRCSRCRRVFFPRG